MARNTAALQRALRKPQPEQVRPVPAVERTSYKAPSREGKVSITAYLSADYKRSLRLIQAQNGKPLEAIIAEALDDVFIKYNVPRAR
jgi:hypothetical protein